MTTIYLLFGITASGKCIDYRAFTVKADADSRKRKWEKECPYLEWHMEEVYLEGPSGK